MNFIIADAWLDMIKIYAPEYIKEISEKLLFDKKEFIDCCEDDKCERADEIITNNLKKMPNCTNMQYALKRLAGKFPELGIDLSDTTSCSEMVKRIGKNADAMIAISKERKKS